MQSFCFGRKWARESGIAFLYEEERVGLYVYSRTVKDEKVKIKKLIQIQKIAARKKKFTLAFPKWCFDFSA